MTESGPRRTETAAVFLIYEATDAALPVVLGVADSAALAEQLADRSLGQRGSCWTHGQWSDWDQTRCSRLAESSAGEAAEVWIVQVARNEAALVMLESDVLSDQGR